MNNYERFGLLEPLTDREFDVLRLMADGLSNPEIAERLIIGLETVRWYTKQIYGKLGVHSRMQASLRARDLGLLESNTETVIPSPLSVVREHLPIYTTHLVGREEELAEITKFLSDPHVRLITLAGPGGMGKTRLSVEVGRSQAAQFEDGVYFVPLLSVRSTQEIELAIANRLNLWLREDNDPRIQLLNHLRSQKLLLILDNFEHVLDGAELVAAILQSAPDIKLLVTSHASLNLRDEWVRYIDGLQVPELVETEYLETYSAVKLFYDRVRRVRGDFSLDDHRACVVQICRMVQGVPLAIELAAAWLKTLTCGDVAREIQHNIDFLATAQRDVEERHRSIQAVFEYAWNLLEPEEQSVFRRLSVFRGGFGLAAAQQVGGASIQILSELLGKSLLQQTSTGLYEIHDLLRQYAERKLEALDSRQRTVRSSKLLAWTALVKGSFDKLAEVAEGILESLSDRSDVEEKGFALAALAVQAGLEGDYGQCQQLCEASQLLIREDPISLILMHFGLAIVSCSLEDFAATRHHLRLALVQATSLRGPTFCVLCLPVAAIVLAHRSEPERAVELLALVFTHPASTLGWVEKWSWIIELRTDLETELGINDYNAAWERGKLLDWNAVALQLVNEL